jgi:hypothetical protein
MPPSVHAALVISIVASALGALVMCALVARYGLTPAPDERADAAARRVLLTRFGHAFAGVCFVATGLLALVAVVVQGRHVAAAAPAPPAVVAERDPATDARLEALAAELRATAARIEDADRRLSAVDGTTRRLGDEVSSIQARARQLERAVAARSRTVVPPAPPRAEPREPREPNRPPERFVPAAAPPVVPVPPPPPAASDPVPGPRRTSAAAVSASPPGAAPSQRVPEPAASPPSRPLPTTRRELGDRVRDDWRTVRDGFATAGDEFKDAVRGLARRWAR